MPPPQLIVLATPLVTYRYCQRETSYGRSSGDTPPPPPLETSRTFFDIYLAGFKIEYCV